MDLEKFLYLKPFSKDHVVIIKKALEILVKELKKKQRSPAHGIDHYIRVFNLSVKIAEKEKVLKKVDLLTVGLAALFHDIGETRDYKSKLTHAKESKKIAYEILSRKLKLKKDRIDVIVDAIETHSFTCHAKPRTLEAKILQDADRLDALGAIGLARCLMPAGAWGRQLYDFNDPFCRNRKPNDKTYTIDHFYVKLLRLPKLMNTKTGKQLANKRVKLLKLYLKSLKNELKESWFIR